MSFTPKHHSLLSRVAISVLRWTFLPLSAGSESHCLGTDVLMNFSPDAPHYMRPEYRSTESMDRWYLTYCIPVPWTVSPCSAREVSQCPDPFFLPPAISVTVKIDSSWLIHVILLGSSLEYCYINTFLTQLWTPSRFCIYSQEHTETETSVGTTYYKEQ